MNTRARIDSHRTLAGVIIAVVLAVFASLVVAVPAQSDASASVADLSFETDTVAEGRSAVLSGSWSVADDATGTASFQLDLPQELRGQAQSFAVAAADGSEVGVCTVTNTTFRCDVDLESPYYLANPVNRSGQFEFRVDVRTEVTYRDAEGAETVEQFLGRGDLAASRVSPKWADASAPPFTISRWCGRRWSVPDMELHSLTRCVALQFDADFAAELSERHSGWARVYSAFVWSYVDIMWVLVKDARVKTAAERYADLMGRPSPPTAATQGEIASYLCISRQAFNRILAASSGSSHAEAAERPRGAQEPS